MTDWYYSDYQRNHLGPVRADDLAELHANGQLPPDTLVWREGLAQWVPWREMIGEVIPGAGRPAMAAAGFATATVITHATSAAPAEASGNPHALAEPRSPYAPPRATLADHSGFQAGGEVVDAGFWKRAAALLIDSLVVTVAYYAVVVAVLVVMGIGGGLLAGLGDSTLLGGGMIAMVAAIYLTYPVISALYYVGFESSAKQATLGKMAVGIKVTDLHGHGLSRGKALGRWFSHLLCYLTLYIGYVMAGLTQRKQGLHDLVAGTRVVDRWAYTAHPERQRRELGTVALVVLLVIGALYGLMMLAIGAAVVIPAMQGAAGA